MYKSYDLTKYEDVLEIYNIYLKVQSIRQLEKTLGLSRTRISSAFHKFNFRVLNNVEARKATAIPPKVKPKKDRVQTCLNKYGVANPRQYPAFNKQIIEKRTKHYLARLQKKLDIAECIMLEPFTRVQDKNGKYTVRGESIGITTSTTSFYDSDKGLWIKSIINPSDRSGANFLNTIVGLNVTLYDYMDKARNNHLYDFKVTNGSNKVISTEDEYKYRGMPIGKDGSGKTLYSSGRDIGNMAAGIVAAKNGIPWSAARTAFDAYQSRHGFQTEGLSTRNAQYYGWSKIYNRSNGVSESVNLRKSINKFFSKIWKMIF